MSECVRESKRQTWMDTHTHTRAEKRERERERERERHTHTYTQNHHRHHCNWVSFTQPQAPLPLTPFHALLEILEDGPVNVVAKVLNRVLAVLENDG